MIVYMLVSEIDSQKNNKFGGVQLIILNTIISHLYSLISDIHLILMRISGKSDKKSKINC